MISIVRYLCLSVEFRSIKNFGKFEQIKICALKKKNETFNVKILLRGNFLFRYDAVFFIYNIQTSHTCCKGL